MSSKIDFDEKNNKISLEIFVSQNQNENTMKDEAHIGNLNLPSQQMEKAHEKKSVNILPAIISLILVLYGHFAKDFFGGNILFMGVACFILWIIIKLLFALVGKD